MPIEQTSEPVPGAPLQAIASEMLDAAALCAIATVTDDGGAYVNTAYFASGPELQLVWLSEPDATHSRNIRERRTSAVAVYDSAQIWGRPDRGIQLFGAAHQAAAAESTAAAALYGRRFPEFRSSDLGAYRFYVFTPARVKLFDEQQLGPGRFVVAIADEAGRLTWETTEVYRSGSGS